MSIISIERMRHDIESIAYAALHAVRGDVCIRKWVSRIQDLNGDELVAGEKRIDLRKTRKIIVVGAGKAGASMAKAIEDLINDKITDGLINAKYGHTVELNRIRLNEAGHPIPDEAGMRGAKHILALAKECELEDLIIVLLSGGGSALLPLPEEPISLAEKQKATEYLVNSGATIQEINVVRKHISAIKGGKLAQAAYPAQLIALILSDVIGDDLESIASGPTVADSSTFHYCFELLSKYYLLDKLAESIIAHIKKGMEGKVHETPKPHNQIFSNVTNLIVGNNSIAISSAMTKAQELGYNPVLLSTAIQGDTERAAYEHTKIMKELVQSATSREKPLCIVSGGETTITVKGHGHGGRNTHFALAVLQHLRDFNNFVVLSFGTDGTDGKTDVAGAFCDAGTFQRAMSAGMDPVHYLRAFDSYTFFHALDDLFVTGPTQTNVMDLRIILLERRS